MSNKALKPLKRKLIKAYFTSTLSFTIVLFLIGLIAVLVINTKYLSNYIRENIGVTLVLDSEAKESDLMLLQKTISTLPYVKSASFVDPETAASALKQELGEDFVSFLGYNPLKATIDVKLFAAYTQNDSLLELENQFLDMPNVKEVYYQRNLVHLINENSNKISAFLMGLVLIMFFLFISLINNTIRLSIYSNRFIIHTMQLVGATRPFIRRPFISRSFIQGVIGAFLANGLLFALVYSYSKEISIMLNYKLPEILGVAFILVFLLGMLISWLSTYFAVNKFLRMHYDELFY